jgi:hypothetical protein
MYAVKLQNQLGRRLLWNTQSWNKARNLDSLPKNGLNTTFVQNTNIFHSISNRGFKIWGKPLDSQKSNTSGNANSQDKDQGPIGPELRNNLILGVGAVLLLGSAIAIFSDSYSSQNEEIDWRTFKTQIMRSGKVIYFCY